MQCITNIKTFLQLLVKFDMQSFLKLSNKNMDVSKDTKIFKMKFI